MNKLTRAALTVAALVSSSISLAAAKQQVVSYVDTSLDGAQKYYLNVDGRPYYLTDIQIRLDKLRYSCGWDRNGLEAIIERAAEDGFNTVSIPVMWTEVEPEKDRFDWTVLDMYLEMVTDAGLRMEMLWFGNNSVGGVAKMNMRDNRSQNRVPDYVLASGEPGQAPQSEFSVRTDINNRTMDISDEALRDREYLVLSCVMEHIAEWDRKHGGKHTVIGVQIENEIFGSGASFPNTAVINYVSHIAGAVKQSPYVVWTRINCVYWEVDGRVPENEAKRLSPEGTNLDFVGLDTYKHHPQFKSYEMFVESMRRDVPYCGNNYRMFMEVGAEVSNVSQLYMAALSGNCAFDYYDMCGIDGHGLYDITGVNSFEPHGPYIEEVRMTNRIILSAQRDIALNANGYGLFVHNWKGSSAMETASNYGISFTPGRLSSQGVSIVRSQGEVVLMSTLGGTFSLPSGLKVKEAGIGRFDADNKWIQDGNIALSRGRNGVSLTLGAGMTARVLCEDTGLLSADRTLQAESARVGGKASVSSGDGRNGFAGNGYVLLPRNGASYVRWEGIDATPGDYILRIRYSNDRNEAVTNSLFVGGRSIGLISLEPTGSDEKYQFYETLITLQSASDSIEIAAVAGDVVGVGGLEFHSGGQIDEIQLVKK